MIGEHSNGWSVEQESLGHAALSFLGGVIEEDGINDLTGGGHIEGDIEGAEDSFDVRDLLLDETD